DDRGARDGRDRETDDGAHHFYNRTSIVDRAAVRQDPRIARRRHCGARNSTGIAASQWVFRGVLPHSIRPGGIAHRARRASVLNSFGGFGETSHRLCEPCPQVLEIVPNTGHTSFLFHSVSARHKSPDLARAIARRLLFATVCLIRLCKFMTETR